MPKFGVFFAEDIARARHPTGRLSAGPAELLDGQDRHKLLREWFNELETKRSEEP